MTNQAHRDTAATMIQNGASYEEIRKELPLSKSQANNVTKNQRKKLGVFRYVDVKKRNKSIEPAEGREGKW